MSFNKGLYLCSHNHNQEIKHLLLVLLDSQYLPPLLVPGNCGLLSVTTDWIAIFQFLINGITQYQLFCVWLLRFSILLRFIILLHEMEVPTFLLLSSIPLYGYITFCPFTSWWTSGWFYFWAIMNNAAMIILCTSLCVDTCFHLLWVNKNGIGYLGQVCV